MAKFTLLKDSSGNQILPITKADAVYFEGTQYSSWNGMTAEDVLPETIEQMKTKIEAVKTELKKLFQDGCNTIYNGATAVGITPNSKSPTDLAAAYKTCKNYWYNQGITQTRTGFHYRCPSPSSTVTQGTIVYMGSMFFNPGTYNLLVDGCCFSTASGPILAFRLTPKGNANTILAELYFTGDSNYSGPIYVSSSKGISNIVQDKEEEYRFWIAGTFTISTLTECDMYGVCTNNVGMSRYMTSVYEAW